MTKLYNEKGYWATVEKTTIGERFVAIMHLQAKQFKTHTGAVRWLNKLGYK